MGVVVLLLVVLTAIVLVEEIRVRRATAALARSEAANDALRHAIPDLMFVLSKDGVYLDYDAGIIPALLVPPDQFLHRHFRDVLSADLASLYERSLAQLRATGVPQETVAFDADTVIAVVRDITSRKESALALQRAQADLARLSRVTAMGELAASIAHDVSQPLSAIVANARACRNWVRQGRAGEGELDRALQDIIDAGDRAGGE